MTTATPLAAVRQPPAAQAPNQPDLAPGIGTLNSYELLIRMAKGLSSSQLVPKQYRQVINTYNRDGSIKKSIANPDGLPNTVVALNIALRLGADPLMVMQSLVPIDGRYTWASQWVIAQINASRRFKGELGFKIERGPKDIEVEYTHSEWVDDNRHESKRVALVPDVRCYAYATSGTTGERCESPVVTYAMAVQEGWYHRSGSKWPTLGELMLRYRAAGWFGRLYVPDLLMGLMTSEEAADTLTVDVDSSGEVTGVYATAASLRDIGNVSAGRSAAGQPQGPADPPAITHDPAPTLAELGAATIQEAAALVDQPTAAEAATPAPRHEAAAADANGVALMLDRITSAQTHAELAAIEPECAGNSELLAALRGARARLNSEPPDLRPPPSGAPRRRTGNRPATSIE